MMTDTGKVRQHLNFGNLALRAPAAPGPAAAPRAMTVIVTGVGRSGTSMAAKVLEALGVPMGSAANLAVHEDKEFLRALLYFDFHWLSALIEARNQTHMRWGFKFPSLQNHLLPPQLSKFRNPFMIVVMRDPVAIASRALVSDPERATVDETLRNVTRQIGDMMSLVERAECPVLLLSYEKFLAFPAETIDSIAAFCRLTPTETQLAAARGAVVPNNPSYISLFHSPFRGYFDGITAGHAVGWCAGPDEETPATVELLADDAVVAAGIASQFRQDLLAAGIGRGTHAFRIDLTTLGLAPGTMISIRAQGEIGLLDGSPKRLSDAWPW